MKALKKLVSLCLVLSLLLSLAVPAMAAEADFVVTTDKDTYEVGDTAYVTLTLNNTFTVANVNMRIWYDPAVFTYDAEKSTIGTTLQGFMMKNLTDPVASNYAQEPNWLDKGWKPINVSGAYLGSNIAFGPGEVATIAFTVTAVCESAAFEHTIIQLNTADASTSYKETATSAAATVSVKEASIAVESITLDQSAMPMWVGDTVALTATIVPDYATDKTITWTSSDDTVATVADGVVTAHKVGSATITAQAGEKTATCAVTVNLVPFTAAYRDADGQQPLTMTRAEENLSGILWEEVSFHMPLFQVEVPAGTEYVYVSYPEGVAFANVADYFKDNELVDGQMNMPETKPMLKMPVAHAMETGKIALLYNDEWSDWIAAVEFKQIACEHTWTDATCSAPKTCSLCGATEGEANPEAHNYVDGKCEYCQQAEPEKTPVTSVTLSETEAEMAPERTKTLIATVLPENATDKTITWTSSDTNVATVEDGGTTGVVRTLAPGEAVITATADGVSATFTVTVFDPASRFPYNFSVGGKAVEAEAKGTDQCFMGSFNLYEVTVPADAAQLEIVSDNETMTVMDEATMTVLNQSSPDYTLDLTKGYTTLHVADEYNVHYHIRINVEKPDPNIITLEGNGDIGSFVFGDVTVKESKVTTTDGEVLMEVTLDASTALDATVKVTANTVSSFLILSPVEEDGYSTFGNTFYTGPGACNGTAALTNGRGGFICRANEVDYRIHFTVDGAPDPEPEKIPVQSVELSVTEYTLAARVGKLSLAATITPSNATNQTVVWETSDASVATVTDGEVKAVGAGVCEITATVDGISASCTVTVTDPAETFPFNLSVNGNIVTANHIGQESCIRGGTQKELWEVTVPADATTMHIIFDGESMSVSNEADKASIASKVTECDVDLTAGYEKLCVKDNDNNIRYHIAIKVAEPETPAGTGYTVTMPADVTGVTVGETVEIPVTFGYDGDVTEYSAFDLTFTYDAEALELTSTELDGMTVTAENGTVNVIRYGSLLDLGEALKLTFTVKTAEDSEVKLTAAKVDISESALTKDAPDAILVDDATQITVTGYTVTLGQGLAADSLTVAPGEAFTFRATDADNYDYTVTAKIGEQEIIVIANGDGTYTIPTGQITGNVTVSAAMTAKSYTVTIDGVEQESKAVYNTDYTFTPAKDGYTAQSVAVKIGGDDYTVANPVNGTYTIPGADITGAIEITVTWEAVTPESITVNRGEGISGNETVTKGDSYTFSFSETDKYDYDKDSLKVEVGEGDNKTDITDQFTYDEATGIYTIPAELITGPITITVKRTAKNPLTIAVTQYLTLKDGNEMFLVTVSGVEEGKVAKYDGMSMYWSAQTEITTKDGTLTTGYGAYAYLVISDQGLTAVEAEAAAKVTTAAGEAAGNVSYTGDVNGTNKPDVNDAQLVYNMYNAVYSSFEEASMLKFLNADMNGDQTVNVNDAAAVVSVIVSKK